MADQNNIYVSYAELGQMFSITAFSSNNIIKSLRSIQMQDSQRDIPHIQLKQVKCQNQDTGQTNNSPIIYKSRGLDQEDNVGNRKTTKFRSKNETSSKESKNLAINSQISESAFGNNQINRLKGQVQQQKEKICVFEQNEIYYKIEVCRLKDQNQNLEETNKRLTQHLQELFEKQKNMITDNKLEQTNYLELNLKLLEHESKQVRKSRERSKTRQQDVSSFALSDKASRLKITKVLTNSGSKLLDSDYQSNSLFLSKVRLKNQVSEQKIEPLTKISSVFIINLSKNGEPACARRASPKPKRNQNYQI